jgi:hypothetical protein
MKAGSGQRNPRIKAKPLIFEPDHKNIATLMAFLVTIFLGLGAGWLVGSVFSGTSKLTPAEEARSVTQAVQTASLDSVAEANEIKQDEVKQPVTTTEQATTQPQVIEQQSDNDEPKATTRRRSGSRRAYVAAQAGESIPLAVIKGKPLKKAFKQIKRVRIW